MTEQRRIAGLGPKGTFTESAMALWNADAEHILVRTIEESVDLVLIDKADEAVVPLENAAGGPVTETHNLLLEHEQIHIVGEVVVPIEHCLIVAESSLVLDHKDISCIVSHPQGLAQCRKFLRDHFPQASLQESDSTASAVKLLSNENPGIAAIAPRRAAWAYGAHTLLELSHIHI